MSIDTIHTALMGIAREGDDCIAISDGLSLVRPNEQLLRYRWDYVQGQHEMEMEGKLARYLVSTFFLHSLIWRHLRISESSAVRSARLLIQ